MDANLIKMITDLVKSDVNPALGCTEPVAVAYCASVAARNAKGEIKKVNVEVSKSIFKNGKSVMIPHTGSRGLDLAAAVGITGGKPDYGFMVLKDLNEEQKNEAEKMIEKGIVTVKYAENSPVIFVKTDILTDVGKVSVELADAHTHIRKIEVDSKTIFEDDFENKGGICADFMKQLSVKDLIDVTEQISDDDLAFISDGVKMNMSAAEEGLKGDVGLSIGNSLQRLQNSGKIALDASTKSRILTAAAADMRMGGGDCPIMTSGGSGNQGLGVILPIVVAAEENNIDEKRRNKAIFFAHAVNKFVKVYSGKLSGMCGCAIGAGIGAAAGITWMLGGTLEMINGACNNLFANLTGIICDGAKDTCSLKLSSCAGESVLASYLSLNGVIVNPGIGIVGKTLEETIKNIGRLSHEGFNAVDGIMLDIIK